MSDVTDDEPDPEGRAPLGMVHGRGRRLAYALLAVVVLVDAAVLGAVALGAFRRHRQIEALQTPAATISTSPTVPGAVATSPRPVRPCALPVLIGTVIADQVEARQAPDPNSKVISTFGRHNVLGSPQVFDLLAPAEGRGGTSWYKALLPIKPNGTTGYIPAGSLRVTYTSYRLIVDRGKFTLSLYYGCDRMQTFPVGIGTGATPTPVGRFYLTGLFKPPDPTTIYGVSIYTLSGFSEVLTNWQLGGIIGLHGTNDPSSIGRNSSHGCIRMLNADILKLGTILPLGTPIIIT